VAAEFPAPVLGGLPDEAKGATAAGGGTPDTAGHAPPPEQSAEGEQAAAAEFQAPVLGGLPDEAKGATAAGGGTPDTAGHAPPEQSAEGEQAAAAEFPALVLGGLPDEAKGATAAGGGNPDTAGHAPPPEEIAPGCAWPLWGKYWTGGLQIGGWADEKDDVGTERSTVEADCAAIAEC
jgi:hypothetical protein